MRCWDGLSAQHLKHIEWTLESRMVMKVVKTGEHIAPGHFD